MSKLALKQNIFLFLVIFVAFFMRFHASRTVPFTPDETEKLEFVKQVSFDLQKFSVPIGDRTVKNPLLSVYLLKLGQIVFGESKAALRFFFVLLGTASLVLIYQLVKENFDKKNAYLAVLILAFSQFHIGTSRLITEDCLLLFFSSMALYAFFRALRCGKPKWIYLTGLCIGFGYYGKEQILLLVPVFLIFLIGNKKYRFFFRNKELYGSAFICALLILPHLIWSYSNEFDNYLSEHVFEFGFSFRSIYLYFGEVFAWISGKVNWFFWDLPAETIFIRNGDGNLKFLSGISNENPFVHWVLGVLIFASVIFHMKKKYRRNELVEFSFFMFGFVFFITSVMAGATSLLDDHWWASVTIYPGVILCSHMLSCIGEKFKGFRLITAGLVIYFLVHAVFFIQLTENRYAVPKEGAHQYYD